MVIRNAIEEGRIPGPRMLAATPELTPTAGLGDVRLYHRHRETFAMICDGAEEFRRTARSLVREGVDTLKINPSGDEFVPHARAERTVMTEAEIDAVCEVGRAHGKRVAAHARSARAVELCLKHGVELINHATFADAAARDALEAAKDRVFVMPTIGITLHDDLRSREVRPTWPQRSPPSRPARSRRRSPLPPRSRNRCRSTPRRSSPPARTWTVEVSPVDPDHGVHPVPGGVVKTVPVAPAKAAPATLPAKKLTVAQAAAMEAPVFSLEQVINEEWTGAPAPDLPPCYRAGLPARGPADRQRCHRAGRANGAGSRGILEVAVKKTEEKRALDDARAEAKKILDKAKAEVAKIRAAVAKLGGKKPRGKAKAEGEAKAARTVYDIEDLKGRKITKLAEPVVRGDSARGALTVTVANCKSTDEALEYQGATPAFIMKMVERGLISVE